MSDQTATEYTNLPVFRSFNFNDIKEIVGKADVEIRGDKAVITIEAGENFVNFTKLGNLRALSLSAFVLVNDHEKAAEYWSLQP